MNKWQRVTKSFACPVCGVKDWCTYIPNYLILCMRVESSKVIRFKTGESGYLHDWPKSDVRPIPVVVNRAPKPVVSIKKLLDEWNVDRNNILKLEAANLKLTVHSLKTLNCVWASKHNALAFPMRDGFGEFTGIRLRAQNGAKWTVTGTHPGLFYSEDRINRECTFVCEGPTNAAAGLDLGYCTVGLPSRGSGLPFLTALIRRHKIRRIVLVCDNKLKSQLGKEDDGIKSTQQMSKFIPVPHVILFLPSKDLRDYKQMGGTRSFIEQKLNSQVWIQPSKPL